MIHTIERTIAKNKLFSSATPVIVMVSGGSDSTALAYIMHDLHERGLVGQPAILHINHMLRGQDAYDDQAFVESLANFLDMPFFACEIDVKEMARYSGGNIEAIGRQERYLAAHEALESLCLHVSIPVSEGRIITAHTQDDRVENFYMRSIKGTGPGGFRSMLYQNGPVVRPCLDVSRQSLRDFLFDRSRDEGAVVYDGKGNLWREDATNAHTDRFRSYVRHEMIPVAKRKNAQLLDTLCRTMNLIADEDDYLNELAQEVYEENLEWISSPEEEQGEFQGCKIQPSFGAVRTPLQRRVLFAMLKVFLGQEARIETSSIEAILDAFDEDGLPKSGFVTNIQGDLAVSSNNKGVLVEPMAVFRARRKRAK